MLRNLNHSGVRGRICGTPHSGVLGSTVPSTGTDGPGYAYASVIARSGYASKEYAGVLGTIPAGLHLYAYEDTSFVATADVDGIYVVPWTLKENGVTVGSTTLTLAFGSAAVPGPAVVAITGWPPSVTRSNPGLVQLGGQAALALQGWPPSVTIAGPVLALPGVGALAVQGYEPTVSQRYPMVPGVARRPSTRAGDYDARVAIQARTSTRNDAGEKVGAWQTVALVWARIRFLRGSTFIEASQVQVKLDAEIAWRYGVPVLPTQRLLWLARSEPFEIVSVLPADSKTSETVCMCAQGVRDGR